MGVHAFWRHGAWLCAPRLAREPGASILRLRQGLACTSKAAYQLLGHAQAIPDALQANYQQVVAQ